LVELPLAMAVQRALHSLVKHHKLSEPFLWIPNLQGPTNLGSEGKIVDSSSWLSSIFLGNADLGWSRTISYLSLPLLYMMIRWINTKLISILTAEDSDQQTKQTVNAYTKKIDTLVSFVMALSYLQLPSGIILYYIFNNIFSTALTLLVRENVKDRNLPLEVKQLMEFVDELVVDPNTSSLLLKSTVEAQKVQIPEKVPVSV
jgi:YidC/Oxa1 family membrane protein insertase